jgi:cell division protein FtsB
MRTASKSPVRAKRSLHRLSAAVARLSARVEDLEDLRDLDAAISRNAGKPGVPWKQARKQLGLA